jgi:hypothetical protein
LAAARCGRSKGDQIVAEQEAGAVGERVQLLQRGDQLPLLEMQGSVRLIATNRSKLVNPRIAQPDFKVDGKATGRKTAHGRCLTRYC